MPAIASEWESDSSSKTQPPSRKIFAKSNNFTSSFATKRLLLSLLCMNFNIDRYASFWRMLPRHRNFLNHFNWSCKDISLVYLALSSCSVEFERYFCLGV